MERRQCPCEECKNNPNGPTARKHYQLNYLLSILDEKQRRILAAYEAEQLGYGGDTKINCITGIDYKTIQRGRKELHEELDTDYIRAPGAGRPSLKKNETFLENLREITAEHIAGNPMSDEFWTDKSPAYIQQNLVSHGIHICLNSVRKGLDLLGYSLHVNSKVKPGKEHPLREGQFAYINFMTEQFLERGDPVLSIDTKKKELLGEFRQQGKVYTRAPLEVLDHDFRSYAKGKIVPYGIYDIHMNQALIYVGLSHDTAEFSVEGIVHWWGTFGKYFYPNSKELLLISDGGGSNSSRSNLWKAELQKQVVNMLGLKVTVCHYPPATSKWNKIEHAVFSVISKRWAGKPLYTLETALFYLSTTRTMQGLRVYPTPTAKTYSTGKKLTKEELTNIHLEMHAGSVKWNYTLNLTSKKEVITF